MHSAEDIKNLLQKYRKGQATAEELAVLESWYLQIKSRPVEIDPQEVDGIKNAVWAAIQKKHLRKPYRWFKVAAAACILIALSSIFLLQKKAGKQEVSLADGQENNALIAIAPGSNKAVLTLADGHQLALDQNNRGLLHQDGAVKIISATGGHLVYQDGAGHVSGSNNKHYNTLTTPRGGQYHLTLPDGTNVWLNAASSISFPVRFDGAERQVKLIGEAYFEVAHRRHQPFKVITAQQEVKVLGTHFNIKNYPDDQTVSTTLLAGSVLLKNLKNGVTNRLTPGQQAQLQNGGATENIRAVNTTEIVSWKNGYFLFDNEKIPDIMKIMSRWYDVDISYRGAVTAETFGGSFSRTANLIDILHTLERLGHVHFEQKGNLIIVSR